jgi:hypothetical protein
MSTGASGVFVNRMRVNQPRDGTCACRFAGVVDVCRARLETRLGIWIGVQARGTHLRNRQCMHEGRYRSEGGGGKVLDNSTQTGSILTREGRKCAQ